MSVAKPLLVDGVVEPQRSSSSISPSPTISGTRLPVAQNQRYGRSMDLIWQPRVPRSAWEIDLFQLGQLKN